MMFKVKVGDMFRYTASYSEQVSICIIIKEYEKPNDDTKWYSLHWFDDFAKKHYDSHDYITSYFNTDSWSRLS